MTTLPPIRDLVLRVKAEGPAVLDEYAPEIDQLADMKAMAAYLGIKYDTIRRERSRGRWPAPEPLPGVSPLWKWRTLVLARASRIGQGNHTPRKPAADPAERGYRRAKPKCLYCAGIRGACACDKDCGARPGKWAGAYCPQGDGFTEYLRSTGLYPELEQE